MSTTMQAGNVTGEIPILNVTVATDFNTFYGPAHTSVGRALALTLRDHDLAAEAVDEAMIRAYQRWDRVGALDNPAGWVYRVGLNYARNRVRRLLRRVPDPPAAVDRGPADRLIDPAIDAAIETLSVDQRSVVVCRLLLGWSEAMTADALDIRPGTVKSRLHRATTQLQTRLHHLRPEES